MKKKSHPFFSFLKCFCFVWVLLNYSTVVAFEGKKSYSTKYVTIQYSDEKELNGFARKIKGLGFFGFFKKKKDSKALTNSIDEIVEKVQEILDMHPPRLKFKIFLYPSYKDLEKEYRKFSLSGETPIAFYSTKKRAIFTSIEDISDRILAHEIAHAVISIYMPVSTPRKMQEILAQYVDVHLWED